MKFTLGWLKEHLETEASLDEITDKLTAIGLELEGIENPGEKFAPFKVAYVESAEKHPDADRLRVCLVDTGKEKLQVVCGAPNARQGMKGIFAPAGSYIPGTDMTLKKGNIRGQESNGMLVSEREMGLSDNHEGIIDLPEDTPVGTPFTEIYGLDDPVIDISLTPNRPDCAGVRGIARDLAAAGLGTLKPLDAAPVKGTFKSPVNVTTQVPDACPLFLGRYIKGVQNGPSPEWLQKRLKAVGLRPISILVDITNYFTVGLCRPLHVFDADTLKGNIHVRMARSGETLDALNDKSYDLTEEMTVVCDDSGVLGIGGIVGGVPTGCTEGTTNVFLEAAYFDPARTAKTGRALQIDSDARYRFERGIDPVFTFEGMELATKLLIELCGGEASDVVQAGDLPEWQRDIEFDPAYTARLGGIEVPEKDQIRILEDLGFDIKGNKVTPPSWRGDVEGRPDLVEEVIRIVGYDRIEAVSVRSDEAISHSAETLSLTRTRQARTALAARGMAESVTWSFLSKDLAAQFGANDNALTLSNPISSDLDQMRPSLLPNLMSAASRNADRGYGDTALFEVGPCFVSVKPDAQLLVAAGIRHGNIGPRHWSGKETNRPNDAMDAKADALCVLDAAGAKGNFQVTRDAPDYYHPGRSGALRLGPQTLAYFGELHPAVLESMDIKAPTCGFEVFLNNIPAPKNKGPARKLLKLSPLQPVERDFAFIADENVEVDSILRAAESADKNLITRVEVFDVYQGKGVEEGKKSVAINVVLQPEDKTLTDSEIEGLGRKIVDTVASKTGAVLRG
ncbi:MAG: phenylalanine--tRNA ligase subunit beta [Rhodospirillales bacterium]|nr:phenylalanine--tRNA ligase subunit beta [Alphaproteobacteria bacterium]USO04403.1 MAG: phenylalanine--tRNA ligase subunit beta [Rhodospirillales bacterium]